MRVVFDTNVVISACFWRGAPFDCLAAWGKGKVEVSISPSLLTEYEETFEELRLRDPERRPLDWVEVLRSSADMVFPVQRATGATPDPFDEMVLECALSARADVLVSGDKKHLLVLESYQRIPIRSPVEFLQMLA